MLVQTKNELVPGEGTRGAMPVVAYLGLGASLGDRAGRMQEALDRLHAPEAGLSVRSISSLYESPHLGLQPGDEIRFPRHLNAVAEIMTLLPPEALLDRIQTVEAAGGRERRVRWGPRTIDIDILDYGRRQIKTARLTVPHPGIAQRAFVVVPWAELAPGFSLPDGTALAALRETELIRKQQIEPFAAKLHLP